MVQTMFSALDRTVRRAAGAVLRVLDRVSGSARFVMRSQTAHDKAAVRVALATALVTAAPSGFAATAYGTDIVNTATATYTIGSSSVSTTGSVTTTTGRTPATIEFMEYVPGNSGGAVYQVNQTYCNGAPQAAPQYILPPATTLTTPGELRLVPVHTYRKGDPIFVRVTDYDQNVDASKPDTIKVTLTTEIGDSEVLTLTETGNSTGEFIGYIQSNGETPTTGDCSLSIEAKKGISASYTDPLDAVTTVTDAALVDPFGVVFDSATGIAVNGALMSIVDDATGLQATVYCDDGVTVLPQPITSGSPTVCDPVTSDGDFRFPRMVPGTYRITVTPPSGYSFPSVDATPAGSYNVVGAPGSGSSAGPSYGGNFVLTTDYQVDIPLDPASGGLVITKTAAKTDAAIGDFIPYSLSIYNSSAANAVGVQITDKMPPGFRYQKGSAKLNGVKIADPVISADGQTMTFSLGSIAGTKTVSLTYVALVSTGASPGSNINVASAVAPNTSNTAQALVYVRNDLFKDRAILMGRVVIGSCDDQVDNDDKGLANARIMLEDGSYVQTDGEGRWHMDNIRPGTHVVQLDGFSLPEGYEIVACEKNDRFAGRSYSQFVNLRGGSLWRADFYVQKKAPEAICLDQNLNNANGSVTFTQTYPVATINGSMSFMLPPGTKASAFTLNGQPVEADLDENILIARLPARTAGETDTLQFRLDGGSGDVRAISRVQTQGLAAQSLPMLVGKPGDEARQCAPVKTITKKTPEAPLKAPAQNQQQLVEKLPFDDDWLATAQPGVEWLHPSEKFVPALPVIKLAVKQQAGQKVEFTVNGVPVDPLLFDGVLYNAKRTVGLATWRGVEVQDGDNRIEMVVRDKAGNIVKQETRHIHYASTPAYVQFDEKQSRLIADGKERPVIAVKFTDKQGYPVRKGVSGEFQINAPYFAWDKQEGLERAPLSGRLNNRPHFEITADGTALIELNPTTQSGEAVLTFKFGDGPEQEVRAWLKPGKRDWVLVGFAEGTAGFKSLSGNKTALKQSGNEDSLYDGNRLAFYAKGMIKGEYLLTMAYDTAKHKGDGGSNISNLKQAIDPNQYYTLYADATNPQYDAATARKLYVKLERNQFYALFGDYDTGLTVTEFGAYSRTLNGLKSGFKGDKFSYNAFASMTAQNNFRDQIAGNGTSGLYHLSNKGIIFNSDKITIETRDRFHSETVVNTQTMSRYIDYDIDYAAGTLFFHSPVLSRDENLNPIYIVAEYETNSGNQEKLTAGGRAAYKVTDKLEVGATHVHEGGITRNGDLSAADATLKLSDKLQIKAEMATSSANNAGTKSDGSAWKIESQYETETLTNRVYIRDEGTGFGLGQQSISENGTRKFGTDVLLRLSKDLNLQGQAFQQHVLSTGAQRDAVQAIAQWHKDALTAQGGVQFARDDDGAGTTSESRQLILGGAYSLLNNKLVLHGTAQVDIGSGTSGGGSVDYPNRYVLGADYTLTEQTTLFAEQEIARGNLTSADTTRVGMRTKPWTGGELSASLGSDNHNDANRLFADMGMAQKWQITPAWQMDMGIDRVNTLKSATPFNLNVPTSSGSTSNTSGTTGVADSDYTAIFTGVNYTDQIWSGNSRIEWRTATTGDSINLLGGLQRNLDKGRSVAAGFTYTSTDISGTTNGKLDARLAAAYRPNDSKWILLDRLDFVNEVIRDATGKTDTAKIVNNLNTNWAPDRHTQISTIYGFKYVFDTIYGSNYSGLTTLVGSEYRHDLGKDWDVGLSASVIRSWQAADYNYSLGASVGYKLMDNTWVAVGYNALGYVDNDFSGAEYRAKGFYAAIRMKFDQDTLGLNKPNSIFSMKH